MPICYWGGPISHIQFVGNIAKVFHSVVISYAINMVNLTLRPATMHKKPCKPMCLMIFPTKLNS